MSERRLYCANLTPGVVTLDEAESRHALQSLRLRAADDVMLFDGRGRLAHGILEPDEHAGRRRPRRTARLTVERVLCEPPPSRTLTLIVAGCKGPRLTWMTEKLTELGTTRIVIADFERSVVHAGKAHAVRLSRTAIEAAKQSQRVWLPEIICGVTLVEAVDRRQPGALVVAHPAREAPSLSSRLPAHELGERDLTAVVGPEGGLTEAEIAMLSEANGELVRLAPHILRVETAAISIAANWASHQPVSS
jgi:16S rRNA (uracil1498-N3)-methyltransferase